jgi:hypothetical protein
VQDIGATAPWLRASFRAIVVDGFYSGDRVEGGIRGLLGGLAIRITRRSGPID